MFITSATLAPRRKPRSLYSSSESTLSSVGSATIVPAASDPSGCGRGGMGIGKAPLRTAVSSQFTPAYSTFIDDRQSQLNGSSWRESTCLHKDLAGLWLGNRKLQIFDDVETSGLGNSDGAHLGGQRCGAHLSVCGVSSRGGCMLMRYSES